MKNIFSIHFLFVKTVVPKALKTISFIAFIILLQLFMVLNVWAQEKKEIKILAADELKMAKVGNENARMLKGGVKLQQDDVILDCDSALFYNDINAVDAFGNVHINQKETNIYSDSVKYNGDTKISILYGNVLLRNPQMELTTDKLTYYMAEKKGVYTTGGKIVNAEKTLTSQIGYYFPETNMAYFRKNVMLVSPQYSLEADTLNFNTSSEISYFIGPTKIINKENTITCEKGFFDPKNDYSEFGENTVMYNKEQILKTDSLQYNSKTGSGKTYKYFNWADTTSNIILEGTRADFYNQGNNMVATDNPTLIYIIDNDSLFISGDTLKSITDTATNISTFYCHYHVKFYKSNLQGKCDSLYFSYEDSIIRMFVEPVIWSDENQLSGDTIYLYMKNQKIDMFEMFENGFTINQLRGEYFNQVKGKKITGYFVDDELERMNVNANAESVYYAEDAQKALIGANKAVGSEMNIYMLNKEVNKIIFYIQPEATFYPIQKISPKEMMLKNFNWQPQHRPLSKEDIFMKANIER
jgi:lipopolysaccharide export system protein LptA